MVVSDSPCRHGLRRRNIAPSHSTFFWMVLKRNNGQIIQNARILVWMSLLITVSYNSRLLWRHGNVTRGVWLEVAGGGGLPSVDRVICNSSCPDNDVTIYSSSVIDSSKNWSPVPRRSVSVTTAAERSTSHHSPALQVRWQSRARDLADCTFAGFLPVEGNISWQREHRRTYTIEFI